MTERDLLLKDTDSQRLNLQWIAMDGENGLSLRWYQNHPQSAQCEKEFSLGIQFVLIILAGFSLKTTSKTTSGILQVRSDLTIKSLKLL